MGSLIASANLRGFLRGFFHFLMQLQQVAAFRRK
jgi:hypothetical protein